MRFEQVQRCILVQKIFWGYRHFKFSLCKFKYFLIPFFLQAVEIVEASVDHINCLSKELRRLFLVEDIVDSIKVRQSLF